MTRTLAQQSIDTLRFLSVDMVQKADSGHPGLPLDAAPMAYVLWTRYLKHHPANPLWADRDRFVLSAGHGSALLYSLLHLTGYKLSLEDLSSWPTAGFMRMRMHLDHVFAGGGLRWLDFDDTHPFGDASAPFHGLSDHVPMVARCRPLRGNTIPPR